MLHCCNTAAIYLDVTLLQHSICLPAGFGRAALKRLPIGHFITQGLPTVTVTNNHRALLPHIFTLTVAASTSSATVGGYFLWHWLYSFLSKKEPHPLDGALLYAVRTFLHFSRNSGSTGL